MDDFEKNISTAFGDLQNIPLTILACLLNMKVATFSRFDFVFPNASIMESYHKDRIIIMLQFK